MWTLNFPEQAIRDKLFGILILQAVLNKKSELIKVEILSSSGSKILDQSAFKIVKLAAPYPPLPSEIRQKWDQLSITRTWVFHGGNSNALQTK